MEAPACHALAESLDDLAAQADARRPLLAPEVEVAEAQAGLLAGVLLGVHLQRQHRGARLHRDLLHLQLDLAGRHRRVDRLRRALHDRAGQRDDALHPGGSEEHTSELQSLMRISYAVFCLKKKKEEQANTRKLERT